MSEQLKENPTQSDERLLRLYESASKYVNPVLLFNEMGRDGLASDVIEIFRLGLTSGDAKLRSSLENTYVSMGGEIRPGLEDMIMSLEVDNAEVSKLKRSIQGMRDFVAKQRTGAAVSEVLEQ